MPSDIRLHSGFLNNHKTEKLKRRLGAIGVLALLWIWLFAAENREDGRLTGMTGEDIEIVGHWEGKPGEMVAALVDLRWLDCEGNTYILHNWAEWQPWIVMAPERKARARRAIAERWKREKSSTGSTADENGKHTTRIQSEYPLKYSSPLRSSPSLSKDEERSARDQKEKPSAKSGEPSHDEKGPGNKPGARRPLPDDFTLTRELAEYAFEHGRRAGAVFEDFTDYWRAKGEPHRDWEAAFRNWVRGAVTRKQHPLPAGAKRPGTVSWSISGPLAIQYAADGDGVPRIVKGAPGDERQLSVDDRLISFRAGDDGIWRQILEQAEQAPGTAQSTPNAEGTAPPAPAAGRDDELEAALDRTKKSLSFGDGVSRPHVPGGAFR